MTLLEVNKISKSYQHRLVLNQITFHLAPGEIVGVAGPSGVGKSTLLNIMGLLESADSGHVTIHGKAAPAAHSFRATKYLRQYLGYLFQDFALLDNRTVNANLKLAQVYSKEPRGTWAQKREEVLERVGLAGRGGSKVYALSGGEQQRVALARVLLKPCSIVLADEPTGSLDPDNRDLVLGLLRELADEGRGVVIVSHDPIVHDACDRVVTLTKSPLV